jgi:L-asparaginase
MSKIALVFTGGTISMKIDERINAAVPALSDEEIISKLTGSKEMTDIVPYSFGKYPGPHITPSLMLDLGKQVEDILTQKEIQGIVVTHGTDTLEETAFFLDLYLKTEKSVVVTGAMRNSSELGYDGPANLSAAICTARNEESKNKGVLVVMNDHIYSSEEVMKTHTLSLDTFKSLDFGPVGIIDQNEVIFYRQRRRHLRIHTNRIEERVALIKCAAGMDSGYLYYCVENGYKGVVIEALGRGNVPIEMVEGIQHAIENRIAVVMVSRCPSGRALDSYGYEGGGSQLRKLGVILGGNLSGQKARIKLMLVLGVTQELEKVKQLFEKEMYESW